LERACEKRPVPVDTIEALVDKIERQLQEGGEREVTSRAIGETVMRELHALDAVAYVRFASVYRSFRDVHELMRELEDLISAPRRAGIPVAVGPGAEEARLLAAGYRSRVLHGRPLVTLKLATTLDGRIAAAGGDARWITGPAARRLAHALRDVSDAVLVGA